MGTEIKDEEKKTEEDQINTFICPLKIEGERAQFPSFIKLK